ncbi:hypothetical protein K502DRAFT_366278 [Neoconidiobolus thromboides FSU 785]|nr:hypothetical protein K502DRAFT_366278 [Neoconidiobolus thromboides FSU 785]
MHVVADFTVIPIGVGTSLSRYVAEVEKIVKGSGIKHLMHSCGTINIKSVAFLVIINKEGEWEDVMEVIKNCHDKLHELGVPRVHTNVSIGSRTDKLTTIEGKIQSVNNKLNN